MTTEDISARPGFLVMDTGPERTFRVGLPTCPATATDGGAEPGTVTTAMLTGPWLRGPAGLPPGGTLGVLVDAVTAYAVLGGRPDASWSVSAEISLDLCGPVPADGSVLTATARMVAATASGGLGTGTVTDASGQVVALCRQHTRWVPAPAQTPWESPNDVPVQPVDETGAVAGADGAGDLAALLGARIQAADGGAVVEVPVTGELANPLGNLHGGVIFTVADLAAQAALASAGAPVRTASVHVAYPRPLPLGATPRFEARVTHRGRSFGVAEVRCLNEARKPCVIATVTTTLD